MAQASRRLRRERRVKRERSQLRRAVAVQHDQFMTVVGLWKQAQAELRELKPVPSFTIKTLPDDVEVNVTGNVDAAVNFFAPDDPDSPFTEPNYIELEEKIHDVTVDSDPS